MPEGVILEQMLTSKTVCQRRLDETRAGWLGAWRFFDNDKVTAAKIVDSWSDRTREAVAGRHVLASGLSLRLRTGLCVRPVLRGLLVGAAPLPLTSTLALAGEGVPVPKRALGRFQHQNFAVATAAAEAFLGSLSDDAVAEAAASVRVPGRRELVCLSPSRADAR